MNRPMHHRRVLPWVLSAALCVGAAGAAAQTGAVVATAVLPTVLIVSPKGFESDPDFANGCWVKLYDGIGYIGNQLTLVGPIDLPAMTRTGAPWRDWDSVVVGPQARATIYDAEGFEQHSATLNPRQRIVDMSLAGFGQFRDIESVRVKCSTS